MIKKVVVFVVIFLFIGTCVVTSARKSIEIIPTKSNHESVNGYGELSICGHLVYFGGFTDDPFKCEFYEGTLDDIGNATCICGGGGGSAYFMSGSTWTDDGRLLGCEYNSGGLWEIDVENCYATLIGGGGTSLNGLAYDPTTGILYGCSTYSLFEIDPNTGEQTHIGNLNTNDPLIDLSFDDYGTLYGWDVKFSGESYLYEIDTGTGEATIVGGMGITLTYAQSGDFCKTDDILYLAAYLTSPYTGSYFVECDKETGECTILCQLPREISIFVIPWNFPPYKPSDPVPPTGASGVPINTGLSWTGEDPDSDFVAYDIYFGNTTPPPLVANYVNNTNYDPGILEYCTTYYWQIGAWDEHGAYTEGPIWNFTTNCRPETPIIKGPTCGKPGKEYEYSIVSIDPDGDDIKYVIDWGDGNQEVTPYYSSGVQIFITRCWSTPGTYMIRAKASDGLAESDWGELIVKIQRDKVLHYSLFLKFLDNFPFFSHLFNFMRWYN